MKKSIKFNLICTQIISNFKMSESERKHRESSKEIATIEEGKQFTASHLPKVANYDDTLKNSYPEGFNERSKRKNSARKSVRINDSKSLSDQKNSSPVKNDPSTSKIVTEQVKKSGKKSALKRKSEQIEQSNQVESSKKKIKGTQGKASTIKEGHNDVKNRASGNEKEEDSKLHRSRSMDKTIQEGKKYLDQSKKVSIRKSKQKSEERVSSLLKDRKSTQKEKSSGKKRGRPAGSAKKDEENQTSHHSKSESRNTKSASKGKSKEKQAVKSSILTRSHDMKSKKKIEGDKDKSKSKMKADLSKRKEAGKANPGHQTSTKNRTDTSKDLKNDSKGKSSSRHQPSKMRKTS